MFLFISIMSAKNLDKLFFILTATINGFCLKKVKLLA